LFILKIKAYNKSFNENILYLLIIILL